MVLSSGFFRDRFEKRELRYYNDGTLEMYDGEKLEFGINLTNNLENICFGQENNKLG